MNSMNKKKYTFHEDFSGAGMVSVGLGSRWECLRACDIDMKKCFSYRRNFESDHLFEGDIADVSVVKAIPAQLAWASFPCQDTSLAGGYAGLAGERSGTFWAWWRIVEGMKNAGKPYDVICIENVRGLLTSNAGTDFAAIGEALAKAGYVFGAVVVDAAHFLPHSRDRLFIVGILNGHHLIDKISSESAVDIWHPASMKLAYDHLSKKAKKSWFWLNPKRLYTKRKSLKDIISDDPEGVRWHTGRETERLISMMSPENRRKLKEQKKKKRRVVGMLYKRMRNGQQRAEIRFDGVAGCLRTAGGGSSRQTVFVIKNGKVRSRLLAPREAARLMGLPNTYKLPPNYNDAYHLCGDGVAVPVVRFLARKIFEPILDRISKEKKNITISVAG
jgi:DNA (cytosine-5)-methyltransferase 1